MKSTDYKQMKLPNGLKIFYLQEQEVQLVYEEVQGYLKNGIYLHEGDTVFDVGANIGLFTLMVYQLCNQNINVYAFEPIPEIFNVLEANIQRFDTEKLKVFPYGLSHKSGSLKFAYYPNATITSRPYPGIAQEELEELKNTIICNLKEAPSLISWLRWFPPFLRSYILDKKIKTAFQKQIVDCQLRRLSDVLRDRNIKQIDLLKVDVEKSELDVLLGIEEKDWSKIKQVVIEVHNLEDRVGKITNLLETHGLSQITVEQEPIFKGSNTCNIYAVRKKI